MSEKIIDVSEDTFAEAVLKSEGPVLVDFWSDWCGPCSRLAPVLDEIAEEHAGRLTIAKVNVEKNRSVGIQHGVQRLPTLLLFKRGEVVATREGVPSRSQLNEFLVPHLEPDRSSQSHLP